MLNGVNINNTVERSSEGYERNDEGSFRKTQRIWH